jgi:hypothetical protein
MNLQSIVKNLNTVFSVIFLIALVIMPIYTFIFWIYHPNYTKMMIFLEFKLYYLVFVLLGIFIHLLNKLEDYMFSRYLYNLKGDGKDEN